MDEFLKKLGITEQGEYTDDGNYFIDLDNDNVYAKVYSILDKSNELEEDEEASQLTADNSSIQYVGEDYTVTLLVDYEADKYALVCREN